MSPLIEMRLIVERELRRNLRSVKGLILGVISLLGASAATFNMGAFELDAKKIPKLAEATDVQLHALKAELIEQMYRDHDTADYLADSPLHLVIIFFLAVWLVPALVALMGFDTVSSDTQYRSVRYWTVRTRRSSYFLGKFFGLWAVIAAVSFVMHLLVWIVTIARGEASLGLTLSWGLRFWLFSLPLQAIWAAIAVFVGSLFKTPILSLLMICLTFALIFFFGYGVNAFTYAVSKGENNVKWLTYIYPNSYDAWLASPTGQHAALGLLICVAYAALPLAAGALIFSRKDLA